MTGPTPDENEVLDQCGKLLRFAAENKTGLPAQVVTDIEDAWAARASAWNTQVATKFWIAYDALCTHLRPVNLDTLSAAAPIKRSANSWLAMLGFTTGVSLSRRWARRFLCAMLVILGASMWLAYLTTTGDIVVQDTKQLLTQGDKAVGDIRTQLSQRPPGIADTTDFDSTDLKPDDRLWAANLRKSVLDLWNIADELYNKTTASTYAWLFFERYPLCTSDKQEQPAENHCYYRGTIQQPGSLQDILKVTGGKGNFYNFFETERVVRSRLDQITLRLAWIKAYILPALLGMLGACTYVVRTISDQIKDSTFSTTSSLRHVLRVALGSIVGVVVVTFYGVPAAAQASAPGASSISLSTSAWAFIAGYAMEAVFATFEAIVAKLGK